VTNNLLPAPSESDDAEERLAAADRDWRGVAAQAPDTPARPATPASRRLLGRMLRPHRGVLTLAVAVILLQTVASLAPPYLVSVGIDTGIPALRRHDWAPIAVVSGLILLSALAAGLLQRWYMVLTGTAVQQAFLELRRRVFRKFQQMPLAFHEHYQSGQVISRLTSDFDALNDMLNSALDGLVNAALTAMAVLIVLLVLNWTLALVLLASLPVLGWLLYWFSVRSTVAYRGARESIATMTVHFVESMNGIRAVQAFRREERNERIFGTLNRDYRRANARAMRLLGIFLPSLIGTGGVVTAVVLVFGGYRVIEGDLRIGVLAAFLLYLQQFFSPLQNLAGFFNSYRSATAALEKLGGVLEEPVTVTEPAMPAELPVPVRGAVEFDAVAFSYPHGSQETSGTAERDAPGRSPGFALSDLSLRIPAGQTVAIVGATGAGKTTLVRLLCRFYDPAQGAVRIDGVNVRDVADEELRRAVVMVTQENFMFSGTVLDNILFGNPEATRAKAENAARAVGAEEFIRALPDGFDTDVGKRGAHLSAGQRQLIAFSRAFLADPAVLVLDEATSLLDIPAERGVQRALGTILAERTALIIAHRLSTVEIADRVLVVEDGRIVQDGSPAALTGQGKFAEMHATWSATSG
jgi:ABC-type multidrug transport system fused ATPase/permease subunit